MWPGPTAPSSWRSRCAASGRACFAGLTAATADVVCFMDADGSLDPRRSRLVAGPVVEGWTDLVLGARRPERRAWPVHARAANWVLATEVRRRTGAAMSDLGPMRAARRVPLLALGIADRRSGWPLEMVLRAARAGWRIDEVAVPYAPRIGRSKVTGTVRGTVQAVRDMRRGPCLVSAAPVDLVVLAKAPAPGRTKTRCTPPCTPEQAAALATAALSDTLARVQATPARRRVLVLDGEPGPWLHSRLRGRAAAR